MTFTLAIALVLPLSVEIARALFAENTTAIHPEGIFEVVSTKNPSASLYGIVKGIMCTTFLMWVFSMLGLLIGELTKGKNTVLAFAIALYYLVPLGNFIDPRNLLAAVGKDIFWFGGTFKPYEVNLDLLEPYSAGLILLVSAMVCAVVAGSIRVVRIRSLMFLRKQE